MRSPFVALSAAAFMLACADAPSAPLLQPAAASFELGKAPPPWALIEGVITTDGDITASVNFSRIAADGGATMAHDGAGAATYRAWLLITPGNQAQLLRFTEGGTATFSNGAMLSNVNGKVSGRGTMTVNGHVYELSAVDYFTADRACMDALNQTGPACVSFYDEEGSFSSRQSSWWTGTLSNDGGGREWDGCRNEDCFCITECSITHSATTGKRR